MIMDIMQCAPGQVWQYRNRNGGPGRRVLIIACGDNYAATLGLLEEDRSHGRFIPVLAGGHLMFTDPRKVSYVFYTSMTDFICTISPEELAMVKQEIAEALELRDPADPNIYRELLIQLAPGLAEVLK